MELKEYWKKRGYERLKGSGRRRMNRAQLGGREGGTGRKKRFWRIKIRRKLRYFNPNKLLNRFRDAYVNFMLRFANSNLVSSGYGAGGGSADYGAGFGRAPVKEYDEKVFVEIYKSLVMAQRQSAARDAAKTGAQISPLG